MTGGKGPKAKGSGFERECVNLALAHGIDAKRAWGSNGKSLGYSESVDVVIGNLTGQCKRRKALAAYLKPPEGVDMALVREDKGKILVIMELERFLESGTNRE